MKYISIDIEAAQPSGEIIQIGATLRGGNAKLGDKIVFNEYVYAPNGIDYGHHLRNGQTLGELLGNTFQHLHPQRAIPRAEAFRLLWEWAAKYECCRWVQWGHGDMAHIAHQSRECGVEPPKRMVVINAKAVYAAMYGNGQCGGLEESMKKLGLFFDGTPHDAYSDAYNTATIFDAMRKYAHLGKKLEELVENGNPY
jgi:hypothetical protein